LKRKITYGSIGFAVCALLISLPLAGFRPLFAYGLALGVCFSLLGLHLLSATIERAMAAGKRGAVVIGYIARLLIYGGVLTLAARTGAVCLLGCAVGLLLPIFSLLLSQTVLPRILKAFGKEPAETEHFVLDRSSRFFEKDPALSVCRRGRVYSTYRHYPRYKKVAS